MIIFDINLYVLLTRSCYLIQSICHGLRRCINYRSERWIKRKCKPMNILYTNMGRIKVKNTKQSLIYLWGAILKLKSWNMLSYLGRSREDSCKWLAVRDSDRTFIEATRKYFGSLWTIRSIKIQSKLYWIF